jgi:hypothetical protein
MSSISPVGGTSPYQAPQTTATVNQQAAKVEVAKATQAATTAAPKANDGDADDAGGFNKLA